MQVLTNFLQDSLTSFFEDLAKFKDPPKEFSDWISETLMAWQVQAIGFELKLVQYLELPLFTIQIVQYSLEIKLHAFKFIINFLLFEKLEYLQPQQIDRIVQTLEQPIYPQESDKKMTALLDQAVLEVVSIITSNLAKLSPESLESLFNVVLKRTEREAGNPLKTLLAQRAHTLLMSIVSRTFHSPNQLQQHCLELYFCIIKEVKLVTTGEFLFQEQEERFWHIRLVQILQIQESVEFYLMQNQELIEIVTPLVDERLIEELLVLREEATRAKSKQYFNICIYFVLRICKCNLPRAFELELVLDILREQSEHSFRLRKQLATQLIKNPILLSLSLAQCSLEMHPSKWQSSIQRTLLSLQENNSTNFIIIVLQVFKTISRTIKSLEDNHEDIQLENLVNDIIEVANGKPKKFFQFIDEQCKRKGDDLILRLTASILRYSPHIANSRLLLLLGAESKTSKAIIKQYLKTFDFSMLHPVLALRYFLSTFLLSGEAQYIDRVIEPFTHEYYSRNTERLKGAKSLDFFPNQENFCRFIYLLIFLHTSHHNPQLREKDRLSFEMFSKSAQDILVDTQDESKLNQISKFVQECFDNITLIQSKPLDEGCIKILSWDDKIGHLHFRDKQRITLSQIKSPSQRHIQFIQNLLLKTLKRNCEAKLKALKSPRALLDLSKAGNLKNFLKSLIDCSLLFNQSESQQFQSFPNRFILVANQVLVDRVVCQFFKPDLCTAILTVLEEDSGQSNTFLLRLSVFLFSETNIAYPNNLESSVLCAETIESASQNIRQIQQQMALQKPQKSFTSFLMSYLTSDSLDIDIAQLDEELNLIKTNLIETFYAQPKEWSIIKETVLNWMSENKQTSLQFTQMCLDLLRKYPDRLELLRLIPLIVELIHNSIPLDQWCIRQLILDLLNAKKKLIPYEKKQYSYDKKELLQSHKTVDQEQKHFLRFSQSFKTHLGARLALFILTSHDLSQRFKSVNELSPTLFTKMIENPSLFSHKFKLDSFSVFLQRSKSRDSYSFKKTLNNILIFLDHEINKIAHLNGIVLIQTVSSLFHLIQSQENEKIILSILKKIIEFPGTQSVSVFIKTTGNLIQSQQWSSKKSIIQMLCNAILSLPGNLGTVCFPLLAKLVHEAEPSSQKVINFKEILENLLTQEQVAKIESSESRFACFYFVHKAFSYFLDQESSLLSKDFMQTVWLLLLKAELRQIQYYLGLKDDSSAFKVNESLKQQVSSLNTLGLLNKEILGEKYEVVQSALKQYIQ